MNETLKTRLKMHVNEPEFCRLYNVEPWILPKDARPDVVAGMRKYLLRDLAMLTRVWDRDRETDHHYSPSIAR